MTITTLSKTEQQVAEYVTRGYSEKEIASKMFISPKTVHNHTYNIRKKWNARSAVDICRTFILSLPDPKQFFAAIAFLVIQFHIITDEVDYDLRRTKTKTTRVVKSKTGRKKD